MNKKIISYTIFSLFSLSNISLLAQQWNGDTTISSPIARSGNVTLGSSTIRNSSNALDVAGQTLISASLPGDLVDITNYHTDIVHGADMLWLAMDYPQANNPGLFTISSVYPSTIAQNYSTKFKVRYNGNVGIGIDEPSKDLDIKGILQLYGGRNGDPTIHLSKSGSLGRIGGANGLGFWANGNVENDDAPQMFVAPSGNVGIGTASPNTSLQLQTFNNDAFSIINTKNNGGGNTVNMYLDTYTPNNTLHGFRLQGIDDGSYGVHLTFASRIPGSPDNSYGEILRLASNGNVGIGITTPNEKLAVNGIIRSKEVKVEANNWPDYVFTPTYKLPTLSELEQQIKEQGHLPNIPSAKEVAEKGLSLGEMNAKLLEKVEELTLLLIQQNKQLQADNKQLQEQSKQLVTQSEALQSQHKEIEILKSKIK